MGNQTSADADCFLALSGDNPLSINFNNVSGLLSSATQQDLFRYGVESGSNQSYYEFTGSANLYNAGTGIGRVVPTSGSMVVLEFGTHIPLQEEYYAAGSLGSYSLQVNMNVRKLGHKGYSFFFIYIQIIAYQMHLSNTFQNYCYFATVC
jgi:hypothetical protein